MPGPLFPSRSCVNLSRCSVSPGQARRRSDKRNKHAARSHRDNQGRQESPLHDRLRGRTADGEPGEMEHRHREGHQSRRVGRQAQSGWTGDRDSVPDRDSTRPSAFHALLLSRHLERLICSSRNPAELEDFRINGAIPGPSHDKSPTPLRSGAPPDRLGESLLGNLDAGTTGSRWRTSVAIRLRAGTWASGGGSRRFSTSCSARPP